MCVTIQKTHKITRIDFSEFWVLLINKYHNRTQATEMTCSKPLSRQPRCKEYVTYINNKSQNEGK